MNLNMCYDSKIKFLLNTVENSKIQYISIDLVLLAMSYFPNPAKNMMCPDQLSLCFSDGLIQLLDKHYMACVYWQNCQCWSLSLIFIVFKLIGLSLIGFCCYYTLCLVSWAYHFMISDLLWENINILYAVISLHYWSYL